MRALPLLALLLTACGGGGRETRPVEDGTAGGEVGEPDDDMEIVGLTGTYGHDVVVGMMSAQQSAMMDCYQDALRGHSYAHGSINLALRIGPDGRAMSAFPAESDLGLRDAERCMVERLLGARFPRPQGNAAADVAFGYEFEPAGRAATPVDAAEGLGETLEVNRQAVDECTGGRPGFVLTLYVDRDGNVTSAGVAMPDADGAEAADCLAEAVRSWTLPPGGSWYSKLVVEL